MGKEDVKLLGFWMSPFVRRVKWALKLKGVEYEYIEEDIYNKSTLLLELNPVHKLVPVLVHRGKPISESLIILEYIEQVWKHNTPLLLPQDPYQKALARFWSKFVDDKVRQSAREALCSSGDERERAVASTIEALEKLEEELKDKKFFGGDEIGMVDIVAGFIAYLIPVYEEVGSMKLLDSSRFPAITRWINDFLNHPLIKENADDHDHDNLPSNDKMIAYVQKRSLELAAQKGSSTKH